MDLDVSASSRQLVYPKLNEANYRYWRAQVLFAVEAYGLEGHLTGSSLCPSPFVNNEIGDEISEVRETDPQYRLWKRIDKLLMRWLLASVSESMLVISRIVILLLKLREFWKKILLRLGI